MDALAVDVGAGWGLDRVGLISEGDTLRGAGGDSLIFGGVGSSR